MPIKGHRGSVTHSTGPRSHKHKPTKKYLEAYWPYLPMVVIVIVGLFFGSYRPKPQPTFNDSGVLSYATDTTSGGLLQATNTQRANNGQTGLTINSQLNSAAQAKANDMVTRNYWSHTTPDGQQPWVFINNTGYKYSKAGENLAYGFVTSVDTINGWMNSAPHRANILDAAFKEVGFGIANSADFVGTGQETVVVAMYATPLAPTASKSAAPTAGPAANLSQVAGSNTPTSPTQPTAPSTTNDTASVAESNKADETKRTTQPVTTATPAQAEPASLAVTRAQTIAGAKTPWLVSVIGLLASLAVIFLLLKHGWQVKKVLRKGERFALHHPVLDTALVSVIMIAYALSNTTGFVR